jgi:hypothetical protein
MIDKQYLKKATFTVVLKKKGVFELNRNLLLDIPDNIKLNTVQFVVK